MGSACCAQSSAGDRPHNPRRTKEAAPRSTETGSDDDFTHLQRDDDHRGGPNHTSSHPASGPTKAPTGESDNPLTRPSASRSNKKGGAARTRREASKSREGPVDRRSQGGGNSRSDESDLSWGEQKVEAEEAAAPTTLNMQERAQYDTHSPTISRSGSSFSGSEASSRRSTIFEQMQIAVAQVETRSAAGNQSTLNSSGRTRHAELEFMSDAIGGGGGAGSVERQRFIDESSGILIQYTARDVYDGPERHVYQLVPLAVAGQGGGDLH